MNIERFEDILAALKPMKDQLQTIREIVLANLVMVGEIPAPTFREQRRVDFLKDRFIENQLLDCSIDDMSNIYGILPGTTGDQNILLVAHADTELSEEVDHTLSVRPDSVIGSAVADNSLGLAVIASLPSIVEHLDIQLSSNLILMGATRSLGRGNLEGLRFFLSNTEKTIRAGISLEGIKLGRLNHRSVGMLRGEIDCTVPEEFDWTRFGAAGAIFSINEVINRILEIPVPKRPQTIILLGSISGGTSFEKIATESQLQFEIRSESAELVENIRERIEEIILEVSTQTNTQITVEFFGTRTPGGIPFSHPLCRNTRKIMETLDVQLQVSPSISELSSFLDYNIPAITLGITQGERLKNGKEIIHIPPIDKGIAQLLGILLAIDGGFCDEN
ncbi:MAG: peptidase [bacterium]|nr:peptidase [bacterium]